MKEFFTVQCTYTFKLNQIKEFKVMRTLSDGSSKIYFEIVLVTAEPLIAQMPSLMWSNCIEHQINSVPRKNLRKLQLKLTSIVNIF